MKRIICVPAPKWKIIDFFSLALESIRSFLTSLSIGLDRPSSFPFRQFHAPSGACQRSRSSRRFLELCSSQSRGPSNLFRSANRKFPLLNSSPESFPDVGTASICRPRPPKAAVEHGSIVCVRGRLSAVAWPNGPQPRLVISTCERDARKDGRGCRNAALSRGGE